MTLQIYAYLISCYFITTASTLQQLMTSQILRRRNKLIHMSYGSPYCHSLPVVAHTSHLWKAHKIWCIGKKRELPIYFFTILLFSDITLVIYTTVKHFTIFKLWSTLTKLRNNAATGVLGRYEWKTENDKTEKERKTDTQATKMKSCKVFMWVVLHLTKTVCLLGLFTSTSCLRLHYSTLGWLFMMQL